MMSPEQCRAARAWVGWSQEELAKRAKVGQSTLKDFESGKRVPMRNNLEAIRAVLEGAGLAFTFNDTGKAVGIALRDTNGLPASSG